MPSSLVALQILLILLPGFVSAYLVQILSTRRPQSDLERVIEALLFSFVIYVCYVWINQGQLPFHLGTDPHSNGETILWDRVPIAELAGLAFGLSLLFVAYLRFDGNKIFRLFDTENEKALKYLKWMQLTNRTTRNHIWNDIFESEAENDQLLQVELADGRSVLGYLFYYSDLADDNALYLTEAEWVSSNGEQEPILGPGILLTKNSGIKTISLLYPPETIVEYAEEEPAKEIISGDLA
jgi:hypothetical protein